LGRNEVFLLLLSSRVRAIGALDAQLTLAEIHVSPFECRDLATPKARFPTDQDDRLGEIAKIPTRGHETLVVREVVKAS
jgi:hypothetical protein